MIAATYCMLFSTPWGVAPRVMCYAVLWCGVLCCAVLLHAAHSHRFYSVLF